MKVLHVASIPPGPTGPGYVVPSLISAQKSFLEPRLLLDQPKGDLGWFGRWDFPYGRLQGSFAEGPGSFKPPFDRPDLVVFHALFHPAYVALGRRLRAKGIPYLILLHGTLEKEALRQRRLKKWLGLRLFFGDFLRSSAALQFLTPQESLNSPHFERPSFILGNGVHKVPRSFQASPGRSKGLTFGFLGRIDIRHKGLDLLVEACRLAANDLRERKVRVLLFGPDHRGDLGRLQALIRRLSVGDLVSVRGTVTGPGKQKALQGLDLFLHTSRFEGQPISVLEAMAHGIPCLVTPGTNLAGEVTEAGAGWVAEGNALAIAKALREASRDRGELAKRGKKALAHSAKYDWKRIAKETLKIYGSVIGDLRK